MKIVFAILIMLTSIVAQGQRMVLDKKYDTIYVVSVDTLVELRFTLQGVKVNQTKSLELASVNGHQAAAREIEFDLLDYRKEPVDKISIASIRSPNDFFYIKIYKGLEAEKIIYLAGTIKSEGILKAVNSQIVIAPAKRETTALKPESKPSVGKDSLSIRMIKHIQIPVYKEVVAGSVGEIGKVNISTTPITEVGQREYAISVFTTKDEEYYGTVKVDTEYKIDDKARLYLNGVIPGSFLLVRDFLRLQFFKGGTKTTTLTPNKPESKIPQ